MGDFHQNVPVTVKTKQKKKSFNFFKSISIFFITV